MTSSSRSIGWLLDISIEQNHAIIWIKTIEGNILKLIDFYQPSFYVLPTSEAAGAQLFQILSQQSAIKSVNWDEKYTDLFTGINSMKKLICVCPTSIQTQKLLVNKLEKDPGVAQLFNTDMTHIQQYLFTTLKIEPTSKVEVEYQDSKIVEITKIDDQEVIQPPPFSLLDFEIITLSDFENALDNTSIKKITVQTQNEQHISFEGPEEAAFKISAAM